MPMSSFGVIPTLVRSTPKSNSRTAQSAHCDCYIQSFRDVATVGLRPQAVFGIGSAVLLGSTFWHSFIGGPVAYTTVPRAQFRAIQEKIFPILFTAQTGLSATLLGFWFKLHPRVRTLDGFFDSAPDSLTAIALATMTLAGAVNLLAVGPATTTCVPFGGPFHRLESMDSPEMLICLNSVMNARVKQEEAEGKTYDQPGVSPLH